MTKTPDAQTPDAQTPDEQTPDAQTPDEQTRSKKRVAALGEVFTPRWAVEEMLKLVEDNNEGMWGDPEVVFLEPTCGNGAFVDYLYEKRLPALGSALGSPFAAVMGTIDTVWAVDVSRRNVRDTKVVALKQIEAFYPDIRSNLPQMANALCALNWHIFLSDALSGLSVPEEAEAAAAKTRVGAELFAEIGHRPIEFTLPWSEYLAGCKEMPDRVFRAAQHLVGEAPHPEFDFYDLCFPDPG